MDHQEARSLVYWVLDASRDFRRRPGHEMFNRIYEDEVDYVAHRLRTEVRRLNPITVQILDDEDGGEVHAPFFVCNHCEVRITDASSARLLWKVEDGVPTGETSVVHKACDDGSAKYWQSLDRVLVQLLRNVGLDPRLAGV